MTAFPPAASRSDRFPVRRDLDGDFALTDLCRLDAAVASPTKPHRWLATAAYEHQIWRLDLPTDDRLLSWAKPVADPAADSEPGESDLALLHAFEICGLWHPPVSDNLTGLSAPRACAWLAIANRWILLSHTSGDLRLLNTACKLIGAVWTRWPTPADDAWPSIAGPLAHTARLLNDATHSLTERLRRYQPLTSAAVSASSFRPASTASERPAILVLAGAGSAGAQQFLADLPQPSPVTAVCWYAAPDSAIPEGSAYASAWYPPEAPTAAPARRSQPHLPESRQHLARNWDDVTGIVNHHRADLLVLIGMPIVPKQVLRQARLGVINAHNGALPQYRGMDAVGWAVLNNDPIVCTVHKAVAAVDQGNILATTTVTYRPPAGLRSRVKAAQMDLLRAVTLHTAATGRLPEGRPQGPGRQYYRLHPHLKRVLDTRADNLLTRT
ncbi:formyltransferase family protein [Micromonospora sp. HUAS LYJ1]|uniref:formyltransferase family protein n=1 Tax=Micromonospora sp. HUAS LYJ1 TaxID=3061626 RepID=UPI0026721AEE|nr:formyltransferase family protein [Micromonospora sp. HUAS LYJ1]WKU03464.1 formyltransferase family protein [Micromonospora sp. HUAS LYJ1]